MPRLKTDLSEAVAYLRQNAGKKHIDEMVKDLCLSKTTIRKIADSQGISICFTRPKVQARANEIKQMMEEGLNLWQIARKLGMYYSHVSHFAIRYAGYVPEKKKEQTQQETTQYFNPHQRENWLV